MSVDISCTAFSRKGKRISKITSKAKGQLRKSPPRQLCFFLHQLFEHYNSSYKREGGSCLNSTEHLSCFSASLEEVLQPGLPQEAPLRSSHAPACPWLRPAALFGVSTESPSLTRCNMHCLMPEQKYCSAKAERFPLLC